MASQFFYFSTSVFCMTSKPLSGFSVVSSADGPTSVFLAGHIGDTFAPAALGILILFYGIYLGKMLLQRKKGIQTDQMAKGKKDKQLFFTELFLKLATYTILLVEVISIIRGGSLLGSFWKYAGLVLALLGDLVFGTAVKTMKDSWRAGISKTDHTELIQTGIYKWSRNPAFLGFDLVYLGILLMYFNWVLLLFSVAAMMMLHLQILQEEKFLPTVFGESYLSYQKHTCRYFGRRP